MDEMINTNMSSNNSITIACPTVTTVTVGQQCPTNVLTTSLTGVSFTSVSPSKSSLETTVAELKKEVSYLNRKVKILEQTVKDEVSEKYNAYKRIVDLNKK